jgi:hypothetical protein
MPQASILPYNEVMPAYSPTRFDRLWRNPVWNWMFGSLVGSALHQAIRQSDVERVDQLLFRMGDRRPSPSMADMMLTRAYLEIAFPERAHSSDPYRVFRRLLDADFRLKDGGSALLCLSDPVGWPALLDILSTHKVSVPDASLGFVFTMTDEINASAVDFLHQYVNLTAIDVFTAYNLRELHPDQFSEDTIVSPWGRVLARAPSEIVSRLLDIAPRAPLSQECEPLLSRKSPLDPELLYRLETGGVIWSDIILGLLPVPYPTPEARLNLVFTINPSLKNQIEHARAAGQAKEQAEYLEVQVPSSVHARSALASMRAPRL